MLGVVAIGVAAIMFGEADDAPGLVLLGILLIVGALAFGVKPALRSRSRVMGLILAAIAETVIGSGIAGWLETPSRTNNRPPDFATSRLSRDHVSSYLGRELNRQQRVQAVMLLGVTGSSRSPTSAA